MHNRKLLLLNGSQRKKGTSFQFASTFQSLAEKAGHSAQILHIVDFVQGRADWGQVEKALADCDIIGLCTPLYVDSLPGPVVEWMEWVLQNQAEALVKKGFFSVAQSGYPDIKFCEPLHGSARCFAQAADMVWLGSLTYGGGGMLDGAPLATQGKKGQKTISAFEMALQNVMEYKPIAQSTQDLITVHLPSFFYPLVAVVLNHRVRQMGKKNGVRDVAHQPYPVE